MHAIPPPPATSTYPLPASMHVLYLALKAYTLCTRTKWNEWKTHLKSWHPYSIPDRVLFNQYLKYFVGFSLFAKKKKKKKKSSLYHICNQKNGKKKQFWTIFSPDWRETLFGVRIFFFFFYRSNLSRQKKDDISLLGRRMISAFSVNGKRSSFSAKHELAWPKPI